MATYGHGQMLGSGINPESFKQDYSGFTRAADIQAKGISDLGGQIAGSIEDYTKQKEDRKKLDASVKASITGIESAIKMGDSLGIDTKSSLQPYLDQMRDPNTSPIQAAALGEQARIGITNVLNFGTDANKIKLQQDQITQATEEANTRAIAEANKPIKLNPRTITLGPDSAVDVLSDDYGNIYDSESKLRIIDFKGYVAGKPLKETTISPNSNNSPLPAAEQSNTGVGIDGQPGVLPRKGELVRSNSNKAPILPGDPTNFDGTGAPIELNATIPELKDASAIQRAADLSGNSSTAGLTPRSRKVGKENSKQETQMTAEQVKKLAAEGFKVNARPLADGDFMVSSTDIGGSGMSFEADGKGGFKLIQGSNVGGSGAEKPTVKLAEGQDLVQDPNSPTGYRIVQVNSDLIDKNKADFSGYISETAGAYARLHEMGKTVSSGSNPLNYLESTEQGQVLSRMFGKSPQILRDKINTIRPSIINVIRKSSEMGAKGMDSEKELSFYLDALGDQTMPVEANIKALEILDKVYGTGKAVNSILSDYPELKKKVEKYDLKFNNSATNPSTNTTGSKSEDIYNKYLPK